MDNAQWDELRTLSHRIEHSARTDEALGELRANDYESISKQLEIMFRRCPAVAGDPTDESILLPTPANAVISDISGWIRNEINNSAFHDEINAVYNATTTLADSYDTNGLKDFIPVTIKKAIDDAILPFALSVYPILASIGIDMFAVEISDDEISDDESNHDESRGIGQTRGIEQTQDSEDWKANQKHFFVQQLEESFLTLVGMVAQYNINDENAYNRLASEFKQISSAVISDVAQQIRRKRIASLSTLT